MFSRDPLQILDSLSFVSLVVLAILLVLSVVSWGIILAKWRMARLSKKEDHRFLNLYRKRAPFDTNALWDLQRLAVTLPHSPSSAVFLGITGRMNPAGEDDDRGVTQTKPEVPSPDRDYLEDVMRHLVQKQIIRHESYLPFLATTGNLAPFIGLLGTVVGVINAFQQIGLEGAANIAAVAPGVSEALIATAAGLFVAIPAVLGYNYYLAKIRKIVFGVEVFGLELLNAFEGMDSITRQSSRRLR